ncbi:RimJ/RimL family protein N-acetyltransferase [Mesorhizobium soli]|uniref:GNAT family N-acetyltransferase n=1 Tax=Pseudaminobacter soli (ex Li et al. 2025) TaxID=1295366 RepID=UPI002475F65D|nr:GNAT family N-acetyltransferase [Mesorhizobium soli]MDH6229553.1 RimJ/RimL family protein N-acetyltransferase [Mesorhizobium soli]
MSNAELNWRVEEACREGWPSAESEVFEGWLLRRSGGRIRRTNWVNPLPGKRGEASAVIDVAEAYYERHRQTPIFRVPTIAGELESALDRGGYVPEVETVVLFRELDGFAVGGDERTAITTEPSEAWLNARHRMCCESEHDRQVFRDTVGLIGSQKAFASTRVDGEIVAVAYGVIHDRLLVLEAVETDTRFRGKGLGFSTTSALLNWARQMGAEACGLQCVADNLPARALYASLGLGQQLYRYH